MRDKEELRASLEQLRALVEQVCNTSPLSLSSAFFDDEPNLQQLCFHYHHHHHRELAAEEEEELNHMDKDEEAEFIIRNLIGAGITVCCVAMAAGLFLGLMTLDVIDLQIIVRSSIDDDEIRYAKKLIPICSDRHRLLVTLLIFSTLAYETLPIFLDSLMSGLVAVLVSTVLVLIFGEIVPSGVFTGQHQLYLGYLLAPLVQFFLFILYPIAKPLGKVLDFLVPQDHEAEVYNRDELTALVQIQHEKRAKGRTTFSMASKAVAYKPLKYIRNKDRNWSDLKAEIVEKVFELEVAEEEPPVEQLTPPLHTREVDMVEGALSMKTKIAMDVYTPLPAIYAVPDDLILDKATITTIYSHGFSRVPVFRRNPNDDEDNTAVTGYLITRQLMLVDWEHMRELSTLPLQRPTCVSPKINLIDLMRILQTKGPILTFVCARPDLANRALRAHLPIPVEAGLLGLITIVDIMQAVLQDRIYDERDIRDQNRALATLNNWAATKLQAVFRGKTERKRRGSTTKTSTAATTTHAAPPGTTSDDGIGGQYPSQTLPVTTINGNSRLSTRHETAAPSEETPLLSQGGDSLV